MNNAEYKARSANLLDYLQSNGYALEKAGNEFRLTNPDSITIRGNKWFRHSEGVGGGPLEFLILVEKRSEDEAVRLLSGVQPFKAWHPQSKTKLDTEEKHTFTLPESAPKVSNVYAYLVHSRGIDSDIVRTMLHNKNIYQSKEHNNCVFVGRDPAGNAQSATMRGTNTFVNRPFRREVTGSDKSYGFCIEGVSSKLYLFESPIDALSHATFAKIRQEQFPENEGWEYDHRLSLGGVTDKALERYVKEHPEITSLTLCLDNDRAGMQAAQKLAAKYGGMGYEIEYELPDNKDWNEDLMAFHNGQINWPQENNAMETEDDLEP